jgi:cytochrome P450
LTKQEVIGNSWILLFAGHETSGNTTHYSFLFLAIALDSQARLQANIDSIVGSRPPSDWTYETDMGSLYRSMVGATMNETLRLMPPIIDIPKITRTPQSLTFDGKTIAIPTNVFIHLSAVGVHRNPRYWPHRPSKISSEAHDLDDFVPERWFTSSSTKNPAQDSRPTTPPSSKTGPQNPDGLETVSFECSPSSGEGLFTPPKGAFIPFSEGARSCPGRRFAQVEITAVLTLIFKTYSLELDVGEWASDAEVERMGVEERREVYEKAKKKAKKFIGESKTVVTLQMRSGVPVRFVRRGSERFAGCYV